MDQPPPFASCSAQALHRALNARAAAYASRYDLPCELTTGPVPSLIFGGSAMEDKPSHHGNFHPASWRAILADPSWSRRLAKPHSSWRRAWPRSNWHWRELDSAASSDALLMNVFCYPRLLRSAAVTSLLGVPPASVPEFGVLPRLPKVRNLVDTTEMDMGLGDLLVEAKLTETGFQKASPALLDRFADWRAVLDPEYLRRHEDGAFANYQLLRGVLAARATGGRYCLICDSRRVDLVEQWFTVMRAVRSSELRCRLTLLTWQELAKVTARPLARWLAEKYGIAGSPTTQAAD